MLTFGISVVGRGRTVRATWPATHVWSVANTTGDGIGTLTDGLIADLERRFHPNAAASPLAAEPALITNARHRQHLTAYADALDSCLGAYERPKVEGKERGGGTGTASAADPSSGGVRFLLGWDSRDACARCGPCSGGASVGSALAGSHCRACRRGGLARRHLS